MHGSFLITIKKMKDIPVVDVNIAEQELKAVEEVVKSRYLIEGKNAREFEKNLDSLQEVNMFQLLRMELALFTLH